MRASKIVYGESIRIRLEPVMKTAIEAHAERCGVSCAAMVRALIVAELHNAGQNISS